MKRTKPYEPGSASELGRELAATALLVALLLASVGIVVGGALGALWLLG